jgi:UDP-N-acetylglucosamine acyltransferase
MSQISDRAYVHPDAQIGTGVTIAPFAYVAADVVIGDGTWIGPHATLMDGARIGARCRIFPGAVISAIPQDLKFDGEKSTAVIGDDSTIRECVTVNRGTKDKHMSKVGNNCLIMAYAHIAHDTFVGNNCILANAVNLAGHVTIEDHAILEGMVAVQQFIRIGKHSFIAGASLVRKNVPPFVRAAREPLSYIGVNRIGLERRGFSQDSIQDIEELYRLIFVHGKNISHGLEQAEAQVKDGPEKQMILDFIRSSEGGVIRGLN